MIGSDDVLACFIAGNVFTWDDWFRQETEDDSFQPTIDMLLNVSVFMWYGAVCPWHKFVSNDVIPIYRLIPLGIMVLLFRRLPMVLTYHHFHLIHQIDEIRHALFVGFFGPIGVSAMFYLYISREFLAEIEVADHERADAQKLGEIIEVVVWFLIMCSIIVHGLSIPLGKLGLYIPRTLTTALSTERPSVSQSRAQSQERDDPDEPRVDGVAAMMRPFHRRPTTSERGPPVGSSSHPITWIPRSIARAGKHIYADIKRPHGHLSRASRQEDDDEKGKGSDSSNGDVERGRPEISGPTDARPIGQTIPNNPPVIKTEDTDAGRQPEGDASTSEPQTPIGSGANTPRSRQVRSIQFADEPLGYRSARAQSPSSRNSGEGKAQ